MASTDNNGMVNLKLITKSIEMGMVDTGMEGEREKSFALSERRLSKSFAKQVKQS